jgi:hypothetical protein
MFAKAILASLGLPQPLDGSILAGRPARVP